MAFALRLGGVARASAGRAVRTSTPLAAMRNAAFSASARTLREVIKESEVPVSVYNSDDKGGSVSFSIPVKPTSPSEPITTGPASDGVQPLSDKVFNAMPPTLQKMTIRGKVVIITG